MAELISGLSAARIGRNLAQVREEISAASSAAGANRGERGEVQVLAAVKYLAAGDLPLLHEAGVRLVGENRAQGSRRRSRLTGSCSGGTSSVSSRAAG